MDRWRRVVVRQDGGRRSGGWCAMAFVNASEAAAASASGGDHTLPLLLLYALVVLAGIVGNVSLMAALAGGGAGRLRTPQLLSVCAADLLVCGASAPLAACRAARAADRLPCHLATYIEAFPVTASTLSLVALAVDRYATVQRGRLLMAVCARPVLAVCCVWFAAALASVAAAHAPCAQTPPLAAAYALTVYCAPILAVAACHLAVRARLTALSLTARAAHGELPLPVPLMRRPTHVIIVAGVGGPERRMRRDAVDVGGGYGRRRTHQPSLLGPQPVTSTLHSRRRLANVLVAVAALFAACWCPHALVAIAGALGATVPPAVGRYTLLLGHAHSALNAATYWALNRHALTAACAAWRLPTIRAREERPSSTNEAALGAFHPRLARPAPAPRPPPSSFLY